MLQSAKDALTLKEKGPGLCGKKDGRWRREGRKEHHMNLDLVSWKIYFPRRQTTWCLRPFITVGHSSLSSEVEIRTLSENSLSLIPTKQL